MNTQETLKEEKSLRNLKQKKKNGEEVSIAEVLKQAKPKFRKELPIKKKKELEDKLIDKNQDQAS